MEIPPVHEGHPKIRRFQGKGGLEPPEAAPDDDDFMGGAHGIALAGGWVLLMVFLQAPERPTAFLRADHGQEHFERL